MEKEIWKDINGYENLYQVSNLGRVKSLNRVVNCAHNGKRITRGKIMAPLKREQCGYLLVNLCKNGKPKTYYIHRLVAQAFIPNPVNLPQVNHKDENKGNNCVDNLEWCSAKYNINYGTGHQRAIEPQKKAVIAFNDEHKLGTYFSSITDAAICLNLKTANICKCLKEKAYTTGGYRWDYV